MKLSGVTAHGEQQGTIPSELRKGTKFWANLLEIDERDRHEQA